METGRTWPVLCLELRPGSPERNYVLGNFLGNNCRHELPKQACGRLASLIKGLLKSLIAIHGVPDVLVYSLLRGVLLLWVTFGVTCPLSTEESPCVG